MTRETHVLPTNWLGRAGWHAEQTDNCLLVAEPWAKAFTVLPLWIKGLGDGCSSKVLSWSEGDALAKDLRNRGLGMEINHGREPGSAHSFRFLPPNSPWLGC